MQSVTKNASVSKTALWAGRIISALIVLFLIFDGVTKVMKIPQVMEATTQLGYPAQYIMGTGILLLVCTLFYVIPQTAILGAILLTGYLGGATAINLRAGVGLFPVFFAAGFGALAWLGLFLRNPKLRELIPLQS